LKVVTTVSELRAERKGTIGFVPTMGAFHAGHLDLMSKARADSDQVIVSLFVNPTQFAPTEDLSKYPRDLARDMDLAESVGVDILFTPSVDELYGGRTAWVEVPDISQRWEGSFRPTHFRGVTTVVAKLFNIVGKCHAYFGWKDLQQCLVIQHLVDALKFEVDLHLCETFREPDGLAMSSRNVYLSPEDRAIAPLIYQTLNLAGAAVLKCEPVASVRDRSLASLEESGFAVDYFELVTLNDLEPTYELTENAAWITAARLNKTRLIDNVRIKL
jgi:pantoate--beta-alanine ligase